MNATARPLYAALFDLDGVLIDSSHLHRGAWTVLGTETGARMTDELFWKTFGMPNRDILPMILGRPASPEEVAALSDRKEEIYRGLARGALQPLPGAVQLVRALQSDGFRLALGSSTPLPNIAVALDILGIHDAFETIVCSDDVTRGKPDPEVFLTAAARIDARPSRCVVIEDAVVGVRAARAAGMHCLAVTTTHPGERLGEADLVVSTLAEVAPADLRRLIDDC